MPVLDSVAIAMLDAGLTGTQYMGLLVSGTEVSTSSTAYARQIISWNPASGSPATKTNSADIVFPATGLATASWGIIDGYALYTAPTGGSVIDSFPTGLGTPVSIATGNSYTVPAGTLVQRVA